MKNLAVILSGGTGMRFGGEKPKQFAKLAGRAVIEYTVDSFENAADIDEIIIVSQHDYIDDTWELVKKNRWIKVSKVVHGGRERFDSTWSALQALEGYDSQCRILFHDAVRPLVSEAIIKKCVTALKSFDAVDVVIPSADTLVEVRDDGCIANIPNRASMRRGQTPQAFRLGSIRQAYEKAFELGKFTFTCDCGVLRNMLPETRVVTVDGEENNIKITHPLDLFIAEKLLQEKSDFTLNRTRLDFLHGKHMVIFGGGSGIGLEMMKIATLSGAKVHIASRSCNDVDITDLEGVTRYLQKVATEHGEIDYVINTAGILIKKPLDTLTQHEVMTLINVNYLGAVNVAIAAKSALRRSGGMLLNFTSSSYTRGRAFYALYSSAKAAVVNLTQALAEEWIEDNVRVNCINPERTATPMRVRNFGTEPADSLLSAREVAMKSLEILGADRTGIILDIRKDRQAGQG
ncbi:SDR family NAD(P)-dependent oxidoreductase [Enterobacteriaceae bacterium 89]|nr:SDR family NAD(P)-dependent oxidoreductase [Enterobacteriaceae bacterium 89]